MKKTLQTLSVIFMVLLLQGCFIQSFQPFYTDEAVVVLPEVEGEWYLIEHGEEDVAAEYPQPWLFDRAQVTTYQENLASDMKVKYFRVNGVLFADFSPSEADEVKNAWWRLHNIAVHSVCRLELSEGKLRLIPLDGEWLVEMLEEKKVSLPHLILDEEDEHVVLTASSQQLLVFLERYAKNPQAFPSDGVYLFQRRKLTK